MKFLATTAIAALMATASVAADWKEDYQVIKFGILSGENEQDRIKRWTPFIEYLERELGVDVEVFTAGSYDGVIQAMAADQIEFSRLGSSSYAAAYTATDGGVMPFLTPKKADGTTGYYSVVTVRCDSGYESLDDLEGKVLAFADPDSTSGYAVPFFNIAQSYDMKTFFSDTPFSGSHEAGVAGVVQGTFDAAATWQNNEVDGRWQRMIQKGMIDEGQICVIWESPEITTGPFTARANLPAELIEAVASAIEEMPEKDQSAFRLLQNWTDDNPNNVVSYERVDHDRYQWIVDMRAWLKRERRSNS
ncbi:Phosphonate ABC transporter phosphate-binding periplasmic component [Candidatus Rhodobacter oscarellae]|uniref:Phosphonate ABC transporter phosphate-binding periplasmic component n=1 Tax=Candidatus Rhodobacter oscarellae TaxID=1675527 RepID=A0A0J9E7I5_9RHOB|nr:phosphonate ABC transporter substrate-binding protein [Candidatus Rhodobacter lobularis]KMW57749.1 Phosphonate ABC transporter phosphate-binding periplasmic component [Candidatus Rhodobacter lobularis]